MQEKLSVRKVYVNAYKYVVGHLTAFAFLVLFYFLGSLLPMFIGLSSFRLVMLVYYYLFLYFAAGCFYKQQIILDFHVFTAAGLRFITAIMLFLAAILICTFGINIALSLTRHLFADASDFIYAVLNSSIWQIIKYLFIFWLFIIFFLIPSFAFISEITGKNRSTLTAFAKTKGNIVKISVVAAIAFALMYCLVVVCFFLKVNVLAAEFIRDIALVFMTVVYFKMYDFFYKVPQSKGKPKEMKIDNAVTDKEIKLAAADGMNKKVVAEKSGSRKAKSVKTKGDGDVNQG